MSYLTYDHSTMSDTPNPDGPAARDDLRAKVATWLRKQGFPFELAVGQQLREAGYTNVQYSTFFRDPRTSKWREIDVVADRPVQVGPSELASTLFYPTFTVSLIIECKHGSKPWVVLRSKINRDDGKFPSYFLYGRAAAAWINHAEMPFLHANGGRSGTGIELSAFTFGHERGHGVVQANLGTAPNRRNTAYNAIRSVIAAAAARAKELDGPALQYAHRRAIFVLPVVVYSGPIFALSITENGDPELQEIQRAGVIAPNPGADPQASRRLVQIVRPGDALRQLATEAIADMKVIADTLAPHWTEHAALISKALWTEPPALAGAAGATIPTAPT